MGTMKDGREYPDLREQGRALQVQGVKGKEAGKHEAGTKNTTDL